MRFKIMIRGLILFFLVSFVSCQKAESNLGADFQRVVGEWENIEGDDRIHISIKTSGRVEISKSTERGEKFVVNQILKFPMGENVNGIIWDSYYSYKEKNGKNTGVGLSYSINFSNDSTVFTLNTLVEDFHSYGYATRFKRIK